MQVERRDLIKKYWDELLKLTEVQSLGKILVKNKVFTEVDIVNIFVGDDERENKEKFFNELIEKDNIDKAFDVLVLWLNSINHQKLARSLNPKTFKSPKNEDEFEDGDKFSTSIETHSPRDFDQTIIPLKIEVTPATEFRDTIQHNPNVPFYHCRSKKRGRVLIINNYDFTDTNHDHRTGSRIDEINLKNLFEQMGGWVIKIKTNQKALEMRDTLKSFVKAKREKRCDMCFVFIMSHGSEELNETIVYGSDGQYLKASEIENYFTGSNCPLFINKPKVIIYQVCRGHELDIRPVCKIEYDGKCNKPCVQEQVLRTQPTAPIVRAIHRPVDDMLIGHATMQGSKAHRDPERGTWYIELICKNFMNLARYEPVDNLLMTVDNELKEKISEYNTVQTSEQISKGFKKLYLNPGIYEEDGRLKLFKESGVCY